MTQAAILMIENDLVIAESIRETLLCLGYSVTGIAPDAEQAAYLFSAAPPDLVLMNLDGMCATDNAATLERLLGQQRVPVVALVTHDDDATLDRARAATHYGYLVTPCAAHELRARIDMALERATLERRLHQIERWFCATLTTIGDAVVVVDTEGRVVFFNAMAEQLTGWSAAEAQGRHIDDVLQIVDRHTHDAITNSALQALSAGSAVSLEAYTLLLRRDGAPIMISDSAAPIRDDLGVVVGAVMVFRDTTTQQTIEAQLAFAAMHDTLTHLPNRVLLQDRLELAVAEAQRSAERHFAILFLDLDHFKLVNDSLGHAVGDRLLKEVAARLSSCTRPYDTVARMGGDEYVILLTAITERAVAIALAERIHGIMARPFVIDGHQLHVTTSIGIRFSEHSDIYSQALLRDADAALYRAKALGRSQSVIFEPTLHQAVAARLALETDLRIAWQQRQFTLAFQPITVLETGALRGFEALLRWQHPTRGVVGPNLFIPVLEESGLIIEVGAWVLRESCRQLACWRRQGQVAANAVISVNLSARQLYHPDLVADVQNVLESAGLPPEALQLEMTESMVLADGQVAQTLRRLRTLGVGLSLDDFGTGYSSLSALHDLPITAVKIDRAFVHAFGQDDRRRGMVRAILLMASELMLEVIAEGIESESQADALRGVSCTYGQGYYYARPMDPLAVERWLSGRQCAA